MSFAVVFYRNTIQFINNLPVFILFSTELQIRIMKFGSTVFCTLCVLLAAGNLHNSDHGADISEHNHDHSHEHDHHQHSSEVHTEDKHDSDHHGHDHSHDHGHDHHGHDHSHDHGHDHHGHDHSHDHGHDHHGHDHSHEHLDANRVKVDKGNSPLMSAILRKYKNAAMDMINEGAEDLNARNVDGVTPLMFSIGMGLTDVVELLLTKGVDIHAENKDGMSALMAAVSRGKAMDHIADMLVANGADIEELSSRYPKAQAYLNRKASNDQKKENSEL